MRKRVMATLAVLILAGHASMLVGEEAEGPTAVPRAADTVLRKYSLAVRRADEAYNNQVKLLESIRTRAIDEARTAAVAELNKLKDEATRAANLDAAIVYRDMAAQIEAERPVAVAAPPAADGQNAAGGRTAEQLNAKLSGTSWILTAGGNTYTITFHEDHKLERSKYGVMGPWAAIDGDKVVLTVWVKNSVSLIRVDSEGRPMFGQAPDPYEVVIASNILGFVADGSLLSG